MTLVYLPGFNSSPLSEKSHQLRQEFGELHCAEYDSWHPDRAAQQLQSLLRPMLADAPLLIGSSLGGFWAYHLAAQHGLRCVLINPCMQPERSLHHAIGAVQNMYTHETGTLTVDDLARYPAYRHAQPVPAAMCTVLHEQGDEVIPYQESVTNFSGQARLITPAGGNHRFTQMPLLYAEIRRLLAIPARPPA